MITLNTVSDATALEQVQPVSESNLKQEEYTVPLGFNSIRENPTTAPKLTRIDQISTRQDELSEDETPLFSIPYTELNRKKLFLQISNELAQWEQNGLDSGILHIGNILEILNKKAHYLQQYEDTKLLLALFELIFENNHWDEFSTTQLGLLRRKIDYLSNHPFEIDDINGLINEFRTAKINILNTGVDVEQD